MTSPSHNKRHSLTSLASPSTSTGRILGRDIAASPSANRSAASSRANRMSWHSSTQSMSMASTATPGDRSSLRAPRRSLIPTPSPRKAKPVPVVQFPPEQPPPEQVTSSASEDESQAVHDGGLHPPSPSKEDGSPQELTPTLKTIPPPPVDSPEPPPTPIAQPLEVSAAGPQDASQPEFFESEVDAPYNSTPLDPSNHELPSFTATPPRDSSSRSYSKLELKSPSHAGVPELPGPPTDESDSDVTWQTPAQTRLFPSAADSTAFKTPRPPGAWADTPAARRRRRSYSDSISFNPLAPASSDGPNWTAIQTPRPPGGWLATPAPARNVQYVDQSVETDTELESDAGEGDSSLMEQRQGQPPAGFSTPVSSFAKGKYHDAQTPAAPGGWVPTPAAARKSVRFDAEPSETSDVGVGTEDDFLFAESKGLPPVQLRNPLQTPPDSPQLAPTSPSRGKKGPGIRVLDAFGNETREENNVDFSSIKTPRRQPIRMVDALGNAVEDSVESVEEKSEGEPAGTKEEVLSRMRQGLDELVHEIHDLDRSSAQVKSDLAHIKELDAVSINSREKRRKLVQQMRAANDDVKDRLASLTNGGTEHLSQTPATVVVTRLPIRWFWIVSLAILQIALAVAMYRYVAVFSALEGS
ncbi:hypothetical protein CC1G_14213 [Coprinopsis cinerea okayama7|uniref:Uncharacterized protein n=1 Tax=Coprinopsis cinerea (strain Okayama-7 / 130 / ATCC MYA-4618 / FGSC 9003) TaxID=240176 RepID=D6RLP2_COPC7|nr:hypothetical protein CC1G_14213 [Coprinopsis cinerea okayama7\|eukprot:XP_002911680.1 hypothetical protein CC1G_14213 [Coprinopsis cinerea okayama7\